MFVSRSRRFCVLSTKLLYVFDSQEEDPTIAPPEMIIQIAGIGPWKGVHLVMPVDNPHAQGFMINNASTHFLAPKKGELYALADSEVERDAWLEALSIMTTEHDPTDDESTDDDNLESEEGGEAHSHLSQEAFLQSMDWRDGVYENQRRRKNSWGSRLPGHLFFSDRGKYSDKSGKHSTMRFCFKRWAIDKNSRACDENGWEYAFDFYQFGKEGSFTWLSSLNGSKKRKLCFVRRRLWRPISSLPFPDTTELSSSRPRAGSNGTIEQSSLDAVQLPKISSLSLRVERQLSRKALQMENESCYSVDVDSQTSLSTENMTEDDTLKVMLEWNVEKIVSEFTRDLGWRRSKNIFEKLKDIVERLHRQLVMLCHRMYNEWDSIQLDEFLEDYSHACRRRWTQNQNAKWLLKPMLAKFIQEVIDYDLSLLQKLSLHHIVNTSTTDVPKISIVILVVGSRGDVQPFLAFALELKNYGHHVRLAAHETFRSFVTSHGIDFYPLAGDPHQIMASMVQHKQLLSLGMAIDHLKTKRPWIRNLLVSAWHACTQNENSDIPFRCDAIIANPPSFAGPHIAEKLGVPLHMCFTMPWTPTRAIQSPFFMHQLHTDQARYMSYRLIDRSIWIGTKDLINQWRQDILQLKPLDHGNRVLRQKSVPHTYCFSEYLLPRPTDWEPWIDVSGFWFLQEVQSTIYQPPSELLAFLNSGPPPIFIGFGSIVVKHPEKLTEIIIDAILKSGRRGIVQRGWAKMSQVKCDSSSILFVDSLPHEWLFEHVIAVVHHGGAGTTSAGLRAGKPTIVIPFFGDQFFWGRVVSEMGVGPEPIPYSKLRSDRLAVAIDQACSPQVVEKARFAGEKIRSENGVKKAMRSFHSLLPLEVMKCHNDSKHEAARIWNLTQGKQLCMSCYIENASINVSDDCYYYTYVDWSQHKSLQDPQRVLLKSASSDGISTINK